jgi:putative ABC transport system ATP-binding protein
MGKAVLEGVELVKDYETRSVRTRALDDVSISVEEGEFSVLAGPSGSGKTTLLNLLGTLDEPTSGRVLVDGADVMTLTEVQRSRMRLRKLGFVFQAFNLIPVLTAAENVEFVLLLQGVGAAERRERAVSLLGEFGLADLAGKRPPEMSGGQQQRVAVARAIAAAPRIVLADEPTANLDSKTAESLLDLMLEMNRDRGVTFLFSTHDPRVMRRARRILHLSDGRIAQDERRS